MTPYFCEETEVSLSTAAEKSLVFFFRATQVTYKNRHMSLKQASQQATHWTIVDQSEIWKQLLVQVPETRSFVKRNMWTERQDIPTVRS
jgi:hypothetical protein